MTCPTSSAAIKVPATITMAAANLRQTAAVLLITLSQVRDIHFAFLKEPEPLIRPSSRALSWQIGLPMLRTQWMRVMQGGRKEGYLLSANPLLPILILCIINLNE